jgi:nucleoside-triphosphatase THEP1
VVCVDEVGPAELAGAGHAAGVAMLLASATPAVLVVRERLVTQVIDVFGVTNPVIVAVE